MGEESMPTVSIDTFFACALVVSVALLATGFFAGSMQTRINSLQNLNENSYLQAVAEHIVTTYGTPTNWGSTGNAIPETFGLSQSGSSVPYELDIDKISRLSNQTAYSISYYDVSRAARLNNIALGISVSPFFSLTVEPTINETVGDSTTYTFRVSTNEQLSQTTILRCYVVTKAFVTNASGETSSNGVGYVNVTIPNVNSGPALLVVFAKASFDDRLTSYAVYSFGHLSGEPTPNNNFLVLSPLNYALNVNPKSPSTTIEEGYVFAYSYESNLTLTAENTYSIPKIVNNSPLVTVFYGANDGTDFVEWVSYPLLPNHFGADFTMSEANIFTYIVTIQGTLYKLTLNFGDVPK